MANKVLIIIAPTGYQDLEYEGSREIMEQAGCTVTVASDAGGLAKGKLGGSVEGTAPLASMKVLDFDAVIFIGGPGAEAYARHPEALRIAHEAAAASVPLGAICIAPLILTKARVLEGRKATVWDDGQGTQAGILQQAGVIYTGDSVTRDGRIVTGNGPGATEEFARTMVELLRE
jgi:protease I